MHPRRWTIPTDPEPHVVEAVRHAIRDVLGELGVHPLADAELLTWELITNALFHTTTPVEVVVSTQHGAARVAVHDDSDDAVELRTFDPLRVGGHGLELVDALSDDWGVTQERPGKAVWFELACGAAA
ncbi:MAG TPA: ATP-binding protein [Aquihabitans sp.]|jgi:anti-sigma regulatory factor (Ser/Thr protein kinase)|nr:ATP-binding protein [Aquihabitans sp.]